jgi:hypothetical protein
MSNPDLRTEILAVEKEARSVGLSRTARLLRKSAESLLHGGTLTPYGLHMVRFQIKQANKEVLKFKENKRKT